MILHTINKPGALASCKELIGSDDIVVLIEDGAYLFNHDFAVPCYVIDVDTKARGIAEDSNAKSIDYATFVKLCTEANKVCAWY